MKQYIFKKDYKSLKHQELYFKDTKEQIVWILDNHIIYYRCYALPETINFCDKVLFLFNERNFLENIKLNTLKTKERLILHNLQSFIKKNNRNFK